MVSQFKRVNIACNICFKWFKLSCSVGYFVKSLVRGMHFVFINAILSIYLSDRNTCPFVFWCECERII